MRGVSSRPTTASDRSPLERSRKVPTDRGLDAMAAPEPDATTIKDEETVLLPRAGFTPPTPAELAARFPNLEVIGRGRSGGIGRRARCFLFDATRSGGNTAGRRVHELGLFSLLSPRQIISYDEFRRPTAGRSGLVTTRGHLACISVKRSDDAHSREHPGMISRFLPARIADRSGGVASRSH